MGHNTSQPLWQFTMRVAILYYAIFLRHPYGISKCSVVGVNPTRDWPRDLASPRAISN